MNNFSIRKYSTFIFFLLSIMFSTQAQQRWTTDTLMENRGGSNIAVIDHKIFFFSGGSRINNDVIFNTTMEIHDTRTGEKQLIDIPEGAERFGAVSTTSGSKVIFSGGNSWPGMTRVDIYDTLTDEWIHAEMPEPKLRHAATVLDNKLYIGGGGDGNGSKYGTMNVYDIEQNTWETLTWTLWGTIGMGSPSRDRLTAVSIDDLVIFAGGGGTVVNNGLVHQYNTTTGLFKENELQDDITLSQARQDLGSFVYDGKVWFVGGRVSSSEGSFTIDIYDPVTETWDSTGIPQPEELGLSSNKNWWFGDEAANKRVLQNGCKMFLLHSSFSGQPDTVVIYDIERDTWEIERVPGNYTTGNMVGVENKIYFVGGDELEEPDNDFLHFPQSINHIDIYYLFPVMRTLVAEADTQAYDFGQVHLQHDQTDTLLLTVENDGDYNMVFKDNKTNISGEHAAAFEIDPSLLPDTLQPTHTVTLPVIFTPQAEGLHQATLTLLSDDPENPEYTFQLQGTGTTQEPQLTLSINDQDLSQHEYYWEIPAIPTGHDTSVALHIENTGGYDLQFVEDIISLQSDDAFSMDTTGFPAALAPGDQMAISIGFNPEAEGTHQASITLYTNDPENPEQTLQLHGTGDTPTALEDKALSVLHLYPNPAGNQLTIEYKDDNQGTYRLINTLGTTVRTGQLTGQHTRVDISSIPPGHYIMHIQARGVAKHVNVVVK